MKTVMEQSSLDAQDRFVLTYMLIIDAVAMSVNMLRGGQLVAGFSYLVHNGQAPQGSWGTLRMAGQRQGCGR